MPSWDTSNARLSRARESAARNRSIIRGLVNENENGSPRNSQAVRLSSQALGQIRIYILEPQALRAVSELQTPQTSGSRPDGATALPKTTPHFESHHSVRRWRPRTPLACARFSSSLPPPLPRSQPPTTPMTGLSSPSSARSGAPRRRGSRHCSDPSHAALR